MHRIRNEPSKVTLKGGHLAAKKTIRLFNYEGVQYTRRFQPPPHVLWSDTWAWFKLRRKTVKIGPTLIGLRDIEEANEITRILCERHPDGDYEAERIKPPEKPWEFFIVHANEGTPTIAINVPDLTKRDIERAIGWYVSQQYGTPNNFRFRWANVRKRVSFVLTPC